jgi:DNA-3-methyladenine glycosylase II
MDNQILNHFKKHDPILYTAATRLKTPIVPSVSHNYYASLCESIVSQQLSVKASDVIFARFLKLIQNDISPENVLQYSVEQLRSIGISQAKAKYILDLSQKVNDKEVHLEKLQDMPEQEVIDELVQVKGIGKWTAEMFLMFSLGRPDVFSTGDLGLKRAIEKLYGISDPPVDTILEISMKWSPYRTYASRVLWRSLDTPEVTAPKTGKN